MKFFTSVMSALLLLLLGSCQKNLSDQEEDNKKKAQEFQTFISSGSRFMAVDYYAESPIDYNEQDSEVILETDLKKYIRNYIIDDDIYFGTNGMITFVQNSVKISSNSAAEIHVPYRAYGDKAGVIVDYIDDQYQPLTYMLHEKGTTYFILSWKRPQDGVRLFSRYEQVL
jgi:hypothetical protein